MALLIIATFSDSLRFANCLFCSQLTHFPARISPAGSVSEAYCGVFNAILFASKLVSRSNWRGLRSVSLSAWPPGLVGGISPRKARCTFWVRWKYHAVCWPSNREWVLSFEARLKYPNSVVKSRLSRLRTPPSFQDTASPPA